MHVPSVVAVVWEPAGAFAAQPERHVTSPAQAIKQLISAVQAESATHAAPSWQHEAWIAVTH